jgi:hypothetical protein
MPKKRNLQEAFVFEWRPGVGPSSSAIENLKRKFPKHPARPPGEAWFMGDKREMYTELIDLSIKDVPVEILYKFLDDWTRGLDSFPDAVAEIELWISWFKYTLPYLVLRAHERRFSDRLLELIISAFMRIFGERIDGQYPGFRRDALETIGQALMKTEFWGENGNINLWCDVWHNGEGELSLAPSCSGVISSSICFCLMYLPASNIYAWTKSLLSIECEYFRAHFLVWLVGTYQILSETSTSETTFCFNAMNNARFFINWNGSLSLEETNPPIPEDNIARFLATIRSDLSAQMLNEWSEQIAQVYDLGELTKRFGIFEYVKDVVLAKAY